MTSFATIDKWSGRHKIHNIVRYYVGQMAMEYGMRIDKRRKWYGMY